MMATGSLIHPPDSHSLFPKKGGKKGLAGKSLMKIWLVVYLPL